MSYRDDHAAALARAEALEGELARTVAERDRLRDELARMRAHRFPFPLPMPMPMYVRPVRTSGVALAVRLGVLAGIIGSAVLAMTAVHQPAPRAHLAVVPVPELALPALPALPAALQLDPINRCAAITAPSDAPAPCRPELVRWAYDPSVPPAVRASLLDWVGIEQSLADLNSGSERAALLARRGELLAHLHPD